MFSLVVVDTRSGVRKTAPLGEELFTLGAALDCDLVLPGEGVADHHCRIEPGPEGPRLVDLQGAEGTEVNGQLVARVVLRSGDVIRIGPFQLSVAASATPAPPPVQAEQPVPAADEPAQAAASRPARGGARARRAHRRLEQAREDQRRSTRERTPRERTTRRRSPARSASAGIVGVIVVLVVILIGAWMLGGDSGEGKSDSLLLDSRLEDVRDHLDAGRFDAALRELDAADDELTDSLARDRVAKLRSQVQFRQRRHEMGREALDEAEQLARDGELKLALRKAERVESDYGDLPFLSRRASELADQWRSQVAAAQSNPYDGLLTEGRSATELMGDARRSLEAGDYGRALYLCSHVRPEGEGESRELESLRESVQSRARTAGEQILAVVEEFVEDGKLIVAINHFEDATLRPFRGTEIWNEMLERADQIEALIEEKIPAEARPPIPTRPRSRSRPSRDQSSRVEAEAEADPEPEPGPEPGPDPKTVSIAERVAAFAANRSCAELLEEARALLALRDFEEASALLALAGPRAERASEREALAQLTERALRPQWFAEWYVRRIQERGTGREPLVRLRSGVRGRLLGSDGRELTLEIDGARLAAPPRELDPDWLLEATASLRLEPKVALDRAWLALACEQFEAFDDTIRRAWQDAELRGSMASAITLRRGLDHVPERGFFLVDGRFLTFAEREEERLRADLVAAVARLADEDGAVREEARADVLELAGVVPGVAEEALVAERQRLKEEFLASPDQSGLGRLREKCQRLEEARTHALELIFDTERYFYPYHDRTGEYSKVQQEVDERVAAVRELWGSEFQDAPRVEVTVSAGLLATLRQLREVRELLEDLQQGRFEKDPELEAAWSLPLWTRKLTIRDHALDAGARVRIDEGRQIEVRNAALEEVDWGELEQVVITNDYREMMGRRRLAFNAKIHAAARWHADWMARTGRLGHFEDDDPERRSPMDRMRKEGYERPAGENCYSGGGGPMGAHKGWYRSSGHHRNMLTVTHTEMASAVSGRFWAQNFGGGAEYRGNLIQE